MADEAFTLLVDELYAPLYRFALSLTRNSADACDVTQQTFYIWAKQGGALRDASKAKSWLFTTLYREFLRVRRRDGRLSPLDEAPPESIRTDEGDAPAVARLDGATLMAMLGGIEETFRAPLVLFYLQELSYREIADTLGVPVGTVMSRLSRGKAQLRLAVERQGRGGEVLPFESSEGKESAP